MIDQTKINRDEAIRARLLNSLGIHKKPPPPENSALPALMVAPPAVGENENPSPASAVVGVTATVAVAATVPAAGGGNPASQSAALITAERSAAPAPSTTSTALVPLHRVPPPALLESLNDSREEQQRRTHRRVPSRKRIVHFDGDVVVRPIASHRAYSKRIRRTLWTSKDELNDHIHRNTAEFMAEGMDWKNVLEDDDMYMDAKTGELIHPYWVENDELFEAVANGPQ
jgi:hypothetical protein